MQQAHALSRHVEGHDPAVVVRDRVAFRCRDRDLDDARAGPLESDGQLERRTGLAAELRHSRGEQRRRFALA
jgi:hypothetical protein